MIRTQFFILLFTFFSLSATIAQSVDELLLSGPMVGYCEMREVLLWVQTNGPAQVHYEYTATDSGATTYRTEVAVSSKATAYTVRLVADQVKPGLTYTYKVFLNNQEVKRPYELTFKTPPLWQYRTDPPEMKIALGSCNYVNDAQYDRPGKPYGQSHEIFSSIHQMKPDIMLWLGDNTYLREGDWYSTTGIIHRNTHTRNLDEMQPLLGSTANYATWDDHDYGPNNSDRSFRDKNKTLNAFKLFWGNPTYGVNGERGVTSMFEWGDADFFLLDNRYHRDPNDKKTTERSILGKDQLDWFIDALISSQSTFKFVCIGGQVVNSAAEYENYANIAPEEREYILNTIAAEGIKNVIFLSGDRHHSELSLFEKYGIKIYDFTASPLTAGSHDASDEANTLRVKGSHVGTQNFGMIEITGPRKKRKAKLSLYDKDGKSLWSYELEAE